MELVQVTSVEVIGDHAVRLSFTDGLVREIDLSPILGRGVFEPLLDPDYFARVRVDDDSGTIVWPNGADVDPQVLHGDYPLRSNAPAERQQ